MTQIWYELWAASPMGRWCPDRDSHLLMVPQQTQAIRSHLVNCTSLALDNLMGLSNKEMGWESAFRCCVWQTRALFVPGVTLQSPTEGTLAAITVLTRLSPGRIAAELSKNALCTAGSYWFVSYGFFMLSRACSLLRLWLPWCAWELQTLPFPKLFCVCGACG